MSEQERRIYARKHYLSHLYLAHDWQNLFEVIDKGEYGKAKVQYDPSMRSYAQDLDLGRQAAIWGGWTTEERIVRLSHLWRYTLLHCTLKSRADYYSLSAFKLLLLLGQESKAIGLAELLTNPVHRAHVLTLLAIHLRIQSNRESESKQIFMRVEQVISKIKAKEEQASALDKLATILAHAQQWKQAERVIGMIENSDQRIKAFSEWGCKRQEDSEPRAVAKLSHLLAMQTIRTRGPVSVNSGESENSRPPW